MNRLDDVLGPENWWTRFTTAENSIVYELSIQLPDGRVLTKMDAGGHAGMADSGDDDKSGVSDGLKRAAVLFGVGRYLYRDGVPAFVEQSHPTLAHRDGGEPPREREREPYRERQDAPRDRQEQPQRTRDEAPRGGPNQGSGKPPQNGRQMFAWAKDQEQKHGVDLIKYLGQWAKLQDFPARMVEWHSEQVHLAYAEAVRKLQASEGAEAYQDALAN